MSTTPIRELPPPEKLKRHKEWAASTKPMCVRCIHAGHIAKYFVRYAVAQAAGEICQCPCGHSEEKEEEKVA